MELEISRFFSLLYMTLCGVLMKGTGSAKELLSNVQVHFEINQIVRKFRLGLHLVNKHNRCINNIY